MINELLLNLKSQTVHKVMQNTIFQVAGKILTMSVTILVTIIITRTYGKVGFGEFNLMQSFPALFFIIADFGLNAIASRELSKNFDNAQKYLSNIIILRLFISAFLMVVAFIVLRMFPYNEALVFGIYLSMFLIITQTLYASPNIIFQVKLRYDLSTIGLVIGSAVILIFAGIFSYLKYPISIVNFSYVLGGIVTFIINMYFVSKLGVNFVLDVDKKLWNYLILQSWPIGLTFVFSQINFRADSIMLSVLPVNSKFEFTNTEAVGIYGLPYKIFEVLLVVPTFFMNSVYPIFVRHMTEGKTRLFGTFRNSMLFLFLSGILISIGIIIFAPFIINILGGTEFSDSVLVLKLLVSGIVVFYVTQPISWLLVTLGKQHYLPLIYLVAAIFNLSMNFMLIPHYSFYASSVITWTSEAVILILLIIFAYKAWNEKFAE